MNSSLNPVPDQNLRQKIIKMARRFLTFAYALLNLIVSHALDVKNADTNLNRIQIPVRILNSLLLMVMADKYR
jgi:hypothetical protein